jgi:hypothetical protein
LIRFRRIKSTIKLKLIDPFTDHRWDDFVEAHPEGKIFHHSLWTRVLAEKYGDVFEYFAIETDDKKITSIIPFFHLKRTLVGNLLICLPNTDTCFPLAYNKNDCENIITMVIAEMQQNKIHSMQIKGCSSLGAPQNGDLISGKKHLLVQTVDLKRDLQTIRAGITRNGRYNLRAAEKQPFTIKLAQDETDLKLLYKMLFDTLQKNAAFPPEYSFLRSIFKNVIKRGYGSIMFVEYRGKIIAGNLYLFFKDTALCKYSAQIPRYSDYRPNYFLHWEAIKHFHDQSFCFYDFGGTDPEDNGLLFFKRNWGVAETIQPFYYFPDEAGCKPLLWGKPFSRTYKNIGRFIPYQVLSLVCNVANKNLY